MTLAPSQLDATASALEALSMGVTQRSVESHAAMVKFLGGGADRVAERADRPFEQVGAVNRCIRIRGNALKSMPLMVSTRDDELVEAGEIMDVINAPFPGLSFEDLVEWIDALVMLTGACYLVIEAAAGGVPTRVRPVGASSCRPQYDADGELSGYRYRKPGSKAGHWRTLAPEEVIPFTLANYQSEKLQDGLSQLRPARRSIDQVYGADVANLESLHNGCEPGLVFDFGPNTTPTDTQRNEVYEQMDANHRGPFNRQRPIVIGGGAKVSDFVKSFTDMEFVKLKSMAITDVCVSLGVPPLVAGYGGEEGMGHGKELEEAHQVFWFVTVLPAASWIARKITVHLLPRFQAQSRTFNSYAHVPTHRLRCPTHRAARRHARRLQTKVAGGGKEPLAYFAWFDSSAVDAVRDVAIRRSKEAGIWVEKFGATQADVIEALDLPIPDDHPWQRTWWKPMALVDVQDEAAAEPAPTGDDTQAIEDAAPKPAPKPSLRALTDAQLARLYDAWWLSISPLVGRLRKKIEGHFRELRKECLQNLANVDPAKSTHRKDIVAQILFDLTEANGKLRVAAMPLIRGGVTLGGEQSMEDAAVAQGRDADDADPFNIEAPAVREEVRRRGEKITGVNQTMLRRLRSRMTEALDEGQTLGQLGDVIRTEFNFAASRANTIAVTEMGGAVEAGMHQGRLQAGIPLKSWLWSRRETGRPWHMACEQETHAKPIGVRELFVLPQTGNTCEHPRATGVAEDDINCGCTTLSRFPDDAKDAALLAFRLERGFLGIDALARRLATRRAA